MQTIIEGLYAQRAEVKRIFRSLDTVHIPYPSTFLLCFQDGNGLIDEDEFSGGLEALSLIPEEDEPPQEARTLFKIFDSVRVPEHAPISCPGADPWRIGQQWRY